MVGDSGGVMSDFGFSAIILISYGVTILIVILVIYALILLIKALKKYLKS